MNIINTSSTIVPIVVIFCPWPYAVSFIYILGKVGLCFFYCCTDLRCVQMDSALRPDDRIRLLTYCTTALSSLCRPIWRYGISKIPVRYILWSACLRWSQFSQLTLMQHMGLCVWVHCSPFLLWEHVYFILISSSIRKYDPFVIVQAKFMKQWYALYVVLYFMGISV